jgi:hypothetical protein
MSHLRASRWIGGMRLAVASEEAQNSSITVPEHGWVRVPDAIQIPTTSTASADIRAMHGGSVMGNRCPSKGIRQTRKKRRFWSSGMMLGAGDGTQCIRPPHFSLVAETSLQVPNYRGGTSWLGERALASKMEATGMGSGGKYSMIRGTYLRRCGRWARGTRFRAHGCTQGRQAAAET